MERVFTIIKMEKFSENVFIKMGLQKEKILIIMKMEKLKLQKFMNMGCLFQRRSFKVEEIVSNKNFLFIKGCCLWYDPKATVDKYN